jgi:hypothetical protein
LDFCQKYDFQISSSETLPHFIKKLQDKNQTTQRQEQAVLAIKLFYELASNQKSILKVFEIPTEINQDKQKWKTGLEKTLYSCRFVAR